jgi:hypothetical protein
MGWQLTDGVVPISPNLIHAELPQLYLHPHYAAGVQHPVHGDDDFPVTTNIKVTLPNDGLLLPYDLDRPFNVEAVIASEGGTTVFDRLGDETRPTGTPFVLQLPVFPHCFPQNDPIMPGGTVLVEVEDLDPNAPIHALLGPMQVATGMTDAEGNAVISMAIPESARLGLHLVTIGTDGTALTADCHVQVVPEPASLALVAIVGVLCGCLNWRRFRRRLWDGSFGPGERR